MQNLTIEEKAHLFDLFCEELHNFVNEDVPVEKKLGVHYDKNLSDAKQYEIDDCVEMVCKDFIGDIEFMSNWEIAGFVEFILQRSYDIKSNKNIYKAKLELFRKGN